MSTNTDKSDITSPYDEFDDSYILNEARSRRPISGILQEIVSHISEIMRSEIRLARIEIRQDITQIARASFLLVMGAILGLFAFGFILLAAARGLSLVVPPWASALIVAIAVGITSAALLLTGRKKLKVADIKPEKTIQTLQENVTWMKKRTK